MLLKKVKSTINRIKNNAANLSEMNLDNLSMHNIYAQQNQILLKYKFFGQLRMSLKYPELQNSPAPSCQLILVKEPIGPAQFILISRAREMWS